MKPLSLNVYVGALLGLFVVRLVLNFAVQSSAGDDVNTLTVAGLITGVAMWILFLRVLYLAWRIIQDRYTKPTPGYAVGLLFIPLFNIYWQFKAFAAYPTQFALFTERYRMDAVAPVRWPYIAYCIIPFVMMPYYFVAAGMQSTFHMVFSTLMSALYYLLALTIYILNIKSYNQLVVSPQYPMPLKKTSTSILYEQG